MLGQIDWKSGLEKSVTFSINNKISFIDSFQFLSSSLDILVKHLGKDDFKYLIITYEIFLRKKDFILMSISLISKILKNSYEAKKSFIVC